MILKFLVIFITLSVVISVLYKFIMDNLNHRKRMRVLDQWSEYNKQLIEWSKEIVDEGVRINFLNTCVDELTNRRIDNTLVDYFDIDKEREKVYNKWGKHIPSLLQEIREKRLNQIL